MTRRETKIVFGQVLIVIVSSLITALNPFDWFLSLVFFYGPIVFVPAMSKNFAINFGLSLLHTFVLLAFIHLFDTVKGSVGGPVTDFLTPIIIVVLYAAIYVGCMFLRRIDRFRGAGG